MKQEAAKTLIKETFENPFDKERFTWFLKNIFPDKIDFRNKTYTGNYIKEAYRSYIRKYEQIGKYQDDEGNTIDLLAVELSRGQSIERARTSQRNFIAQYLKNKEYREGALVAFYSEDSDDWRFSFIKMEYSLEKKKDELTPAKRFSFLVEKDRSHTAQNQLSSLLTMQTPPLLGEIEAAFNIETVTKEFFEKYKQLFLDLNEHIEKEIKKSKSLREELQTKSIDSISFTKKLLGQIVFLYFLQKKGWLGVPKNENWGAGDRRFLRTLLDKAVAEKSKFFSDYLVYLFYEALATEHRGRSDSSYYKKFDCRIPFLNGGLFEADYNWQEISVDIPNKFFTNSNKTKEGDKGDGILDVFDRYNFTVKEDEPLEKEVAVDPEMLGKVFENLLEVKDRKSKGAYYTPREIVHYMCQESLINYLDTTVNGDTSSFLKIGSSQTDTFGNNGKKGQLDLTSQVNGGTILPREDIEKFIREGLTTIEHDALKETGKLISKDYGLPESIRNHAKKIDKALADIRICDPAIGSGAFPVGIMMEIVKAREILTPYLKDLNQERTAYELKRHSIQESIYGVDIDHSAIDIAKLRLWLSLVVDEEDFHKIKPLPNLDYKIVQGDSLIGLPDGVLKNDQAEKELEKLKDEYFNETDSLRKMALRKQINNTISKILSTANQFLSYEVKFDYRLFFSEVFHEKGGFDVFLGNPPYIGQKGHKELFQAIKATSFGKKYHQRRMDLFYFFFHLAINRLKPRGVLSFITTNYFLTATYSDKLRQHLYESTSILSLFNFNELKVFESAQGQHNLITLLKKGKDNNITANTAITERRGLADEKLLHFILSKKDDLTSYYVQDQANVFEKDNLYIRIEPNRDTSERKASKKDIHSILNKLRQESEPLGNFIDITTGIQSSSDKVTASFLKKYPSLQVKQGEGIYLLTNKEIQEKSFTPEDKQLIKKTYKNSDVKRWCFFPDNKLNVIYIKSDGSYFKISNGIKKHLDRYKLILVNRNVRAGSVTLKDYDDYLNGKKEISYIMNASSMKNGNYYCLSYARGGKDTFEIPKIVNPRRAKGNVFAYENKGYYEQSDIVVSTLKKKYNGKVELKYLLAIINSKLIYKWLFYKGKRKGDMFELFQKPISEIPIKIARNQTALVNNVNQILEGKKNNPSANISRFEKQIDIMVYHLYNLTYEEAKIVDPELTEEEYEKIKL